MRTVITENHVSALMEIASADFPRLHEQFEALEWRLAHKPEGGVKIGDQHWVFRQGKVLSSLPELVVLYTFSNQQVNILAIRILP